ncbi:YaiI/YqxD family protein [Clostridium aminobutyricum]|uniref:UPF0178 protein JYB65_13890 n=1 Tax=Clostridium aminobutyricum TaxID=33953 RepID=A0A939DAK7_CLOAM|nr:YaiI/YqxD family protein [Clostridium aminobutyricum]MBN7774454.1 YaiI/YqxD family protein [Clostridium aminobutyricum]
MRILIDADGCPVIDIAIKLAGEYQIECILLCDTSHFFKREGAMTITVAKGMDSVDFALVNMLQKGDIVITQDYGLAAMCLARQAIVISQNGLIYNDDNIDALLSQRHIAKKIRLSGGRMKGHPKRKPSQDHDFKEMLDKCLRDSKF